MDSIIKKYFGDIFIDTIKVCSIVDFLTCNIVRKMLLSILSLTIKITYRFEYQKLNECKIVGGPQILLTWSQSICYDVN